MQRVSEGTSTTGDEFERLAAPFRRELLAHCYRMLGSVDDAQDIVQEVYLRAWRSFSAFEARSSLRVWLYRIATNASLTALDQRKRRALPSGLAAPAESVDASTTPDLEVAWLEPLPDALVAGTEPSRESAEDPASALVRRERLGLALVAALQLLPARQRAVLLLTEVLDFSAVEAAAVLETSVAAVKSSLQRARARLDELPPRDAWPLPSDEAGRAQLAQYIAAFESSDVALLAEVLRQDASLEMVGTRTWFAGRVLCLGYIAKVIGAPGEWRMHPTAANGQPAAAIYRRTPDGAYEAFGVTVLGVTTTGIAQIVLFANPDLLAHFGFPPRA
jgi:RNA polymerase sigma-70 factor (ECF subfamily)